MSDTAARNAHPSDAGPVVPDLVLDCRGLSCPLPVLKTRKALDTMEIGQILQLVSTDPGSVPDIAAFCDTTGHEIIGQRVGGGEYVFYLCKA